MPHYKDGTPAQLGDVVRGTGYNLKTALGGPRVFVGTVVGLTPGSGSCNIQVAHVVAESVQESPSTHFFRQQDNVVIGCGADGGKSGPKMAAKVGLEYGQCDAFEKIG